MDVGRKVLVELCIHCLGNLLLCTLRRSMVLWSLLINDCRFWKGHVAVTLLNQTMVNQLKAPVFCCSMLRDELGISLREF